jgi:hypothetical protein
MGAQRFLARAEIMAMGLFGDQVALNPAERRLLVALAQRGVPFIVVGDRSGFVGQSGSTCTD